MLIRSLVILPFFLALAIAAAKGSARLLPDEGQIAYGAGREGALDVNIIDVRSRLIVNLTRAFPRDVRALSWADSHALYVLAAAETSDAGRTLHRLDVRAQRMDEPLAANVEYEPTWSPDQTRYVRREAEGWLALYDHDGQRLRRLTFNGSDPAWSPDGTIIAFVCEDMTTQKLCIISPDGPEGARFLIAGGVNYYNPDWAPDGRHLVSTSSLDGDLELYVMDTPCLPACQNTMLRLTDNDTPDYAPDWSPDGTRITFVCYEGTLEAICVVNADGSGLRRLTPPAPGVRHLWPIWRLGR